MPWRLQSGAGLVAVSQVRIRIRTRMASVRLDYPGVSRFPEVYGGASIGISDLKVALATALF